MLESDVYRRQIVTYKDGPHAEKVQVNIQLGMRNTVSMPTLSMYRADVQRT